MAESYFISLQLKKIEDQNKKIANLETKLAEVKTELAEFKKRRDAVEADYEDWSVFEGYPWG